MEEATEIAYNMGGTFEPDFDPAIEDAIEYLREGHGLSATCSNAWGADAIRAIGERMPETHAYIREKLHGGVLQRISVTTERKPSSESTRGLLFSLASIMEEGLRNNDLPNVQNDTFWHNIETYLQQGRTQPDGSRTAKKVLRMIASWYRDPAMHGILLGRTSLSGVTEEKKTALRNNISQWLEAFPAPSVNVVRFSTRLKGFFRLGEYRADPNSCFGRGGQDQWDKFVLAQIPNSFVATVSGGDEGLGRAWGIWDEDKFYVTNAYERHLGTPEYVMGCIIKAAKILGLETEGKQSVQGTTRNERPSGFPFYLNRDAQSFTSHENYKVSYAPSQVLCLKCGDTATNWLEAHGVWCSDPDHRRPPEQQCYWCDDCFEGDTYTVSGELSCESCWDDAPQCFSCEESYRSGNIEWVGNNPWCTDCIERYCTSCPECDTTIPDGNLFRFINRDRDSVCEECWNDRRIDCFQCETPDNHVDDCSIVVINGNDQHFCKGCYDTHMEAVNSE